MRGWGAAPAVEFSIHVCYNPGMNAPFTPGKTLKLIKIGNSVGVILPKETLARLGVELGDMVDVSEGPEGIRMQRHDHGFAVQMEIAREVMKRRRNALRELAK